MPVRGAVRFCVGRLTPLRNGDYGCLAWAQSLEKRAHYAEPGSPAPAQAPNCRETLSQLDDFVVMSDGHPGATEHDRRRAVFLGRQLYCPFNLGFFQAAAFDHKVQMDFGENFWVLIGARGLNKSLAALHRLARFF